ncbi:MAG TPA: sodium-translocating pyrophosphatase [Chloroflexota bacterium]|nr:sodium-translocating pyrophosphatase [Chloroflexota bacterium]
MSGIVWLVPLSGIIAVIAAAVLARDVLSRPKGTPEMQEVAGAIYEGAMAFLNRQYRTIGMLSVVAAVLIGALLGAIAPPMGDVSAGELAWRTSVAFLVGAACSAVAGFVGMWISVQANLRTAAAATESLKAALQVSLRGGAVSGLLVVSLSLLGVLAIFAAYGGFTRPDIAPYLIVGFGFGASFVALFAQLGGGIYTKAADVGSDLVGKVEAGIPEDDPRNAAVVADLVGDNVGDCAGRGADLFESTAAENIGAMILGITIYLATNDVAWVFFPLVVRSVGLVASIVGVYVVGAGQGEVTDAQASLDRGYWTMTILCAIGIIAVTIVMLQSWWLVGAGLIGLVTSVIFVYLTQYYTAGSWRPVQEIARASRTGPATNIISGFAVGLETTGPTAIVISAALLASYYCGSQWAASFPALPAYLLTHGVEASRVGSEASVVGGLFGTAVATMGMLTTVAYILAMDTFGPITDNAGGIAEMSDAPEETRRRTDALDAVGNTTKALTKGYAIASAALAAFLLFSAYLDEVKKITRTTHIPVDLTDVSVFIGGFLGATLVFFFCALTIRAVGKAAGDIIEEVRRQFREEPGIMLGTVKPDYARCVDITTKAALREMVVPGILVVAFPVVVGLVLKAEAMASFLMVGTMAGILMATVLNNSGGAWDNAKKFIESGELIDLSIPAAADGKLTPYAKGSAPHAAAVVGDTVGDPFKDTSGPSLHVLIKLLSTITLVLAPLFIR